MAKNFIGNEWINVRTLGADDVVSLLKKKKRHGRNKYRRKRTG